MIENSILSFDVGLRHLAFCKMTHRGSSKTIIIEDWDVIDLGQVSDVETCAERLMTALDSRFRSIVVDLVLIERQPKARSIIMVAVQMFLCSYFSMAKLENRVSKVKFISASRKLEMNYGGLDSTETLATLSTLPKSTTLLKSTTLPKSTATLATKKYAQNKKYAIDTAKHYLEHILEDFANLAFMMSFSKKDDLCDSFLQGVAYIETGGITSKGYKRKSKKVKTERSVKIDKIDKIKTENVENSNNLDKIVKIILDKSLKSQKSQKSLKSQKT